MNYQILLFNISCFNFSPISRSFVCQLTGLPLFCILIVCVHEFSHCAACKRRGVEIIDVAVFGYSLIKKAKDKSFNSYCVFKKSRQDRFIYMSGIVGSLLILILVALFHIFIQPIYPYLIVSGIYLLSNIMPVKGSDLTNMILSWNRNQEEDTG